MPDPPYDEIEDITIYGDIAPDTPIDPTDKAAMEAFRDTLNEQLEIDAVPSRMAIVAITRYEVFQIPAGHQAEYEGMTDEDQLAYYMEHVSDLNPTI